MRLTETAVRTITLPTGKRDHVVWDDAVPCFGVRIREGGSKTYVFQYKIGTKSRKMTLGRVGAIDFGKARSAAKELYARKSLGQDPAGRRKEGQARAGETFEHCMGLYLARRRSEGKLRASTYGEIERHLLRNLKALHSIPIHSLERRAIALELGRFTDESGPVQANRTRASLVKFLNWCAGEGFIDSNPATFTNKNPEQPRDRVLTLPELKAIWLALPDGDFGDIVKLLTLTGQRREEIAQLRWGEVDLDRGLITLAPARTKNRRWHTIPLAAKAREILAARATGRVLVFGHGQGGFSAWSYAKGRLGLQLAPWVIHDLRRAVATGMGEIGVLPHVIEATLNHVSGHRAGVAGTYNRAAYEGEKAQALSRWNDHLMAIVGGAAQ
jgi:integrase